MLRQCLKSGTQQSFKGAPDVFREASERLQDAPRTLSQDGPKRPTSHALRSKVGRLTVFEDPK
eukprot:2546819-Pyramimonas_sp.AAC.1